MPEKKYKPTEVLEAKERHIKDLMVLIQIFTLQKLLLCWKC
ncbi:MAG: hypothetical protein PHQ76_05720 [Caldisericia bacterium]|nr:hypothetical protein [Caldisericia bacterium]